MARLQRSLSALFRDQIERSISSIVRERQHLGKQPGILGRGRGLREHRIELVKLGLRFVIVRQSGGAFHLADDRIKRAVRVLRGAEIAQARVRLGCEAFQKRRGEPRLPNTGLAGEQDHLAFTGLCPGPAPKQQVLFFLAANKGGQAGSVQGVKAALHGTRPQRSPGPRRPGDAFEALCSEVLQLKEIAKKSPGALGDDDRVRFGQRLQPRCKVRRSPTMPRSCASPEPRGLQQP